MPTPARVVVRLQGPGPLRIEDVEAPDPAAGEVSARSLLELG